MSLMHYKHDEIIPDKISDFRVWKHQQNMVNENIIGRAKKSQSQIKDFTEVLNDDYKNNKDLNYKTLLKTTSTKDPNKFNNVLSPTVNKIVTDVGKLISEMKKSEENLSKMNIVSLIKTKDQVKKTEKLGDQSSMIKMKEKEYQKSLGGKTKRSPNYKYLSDFYRKQLNRVFLNYNPIKHLGSIHMLSKENPETNEKYQAQTKLIEKDIFNITSPNFYRNQYKKFQKMFSVEKDKDTEENNATEGNEEKNNIIMEKQDSKKVRNKDLSLPRLAYRTTMGFHKGNKYYATEADDPNLKKKNINNHFKPNNRFNLLYKFGQKNKKKKKSEMKRKFPDKEGRKIELELMEDACKRIINSIKYIEDNDNNFYYKYSRLNNDERKKEHNFILRDNLKAEKILLQIQNNNLLRGIDDMVENKTKKVNEDIKGYGSQIYEIKDEILQNIEEQERKEKNNYII